MRQQRIVTLHPYLLGGTCWVFDDEGADHQGGSGESHLARFGSLEQPVRKAADAALPIDTDHRGRTASDDRRAANDLVVVVDARATDLFHVGPHEEQIVLFCGR